MTNKPAKTRLKRQGEQIQLESLSKKWIRGDMQASPCLADDVRPLFIHYRGADAFAFYTEVVEEMDNSGFCRSSQPKSPDMDGKRRR
jgi:hypothetical protein